MVLLSLEKGGGGQEGGSSHLVIEVPDGDTDTAIDLQASTDDGGVVHGLLLDGGVVGGHGRVADIELGIGNLDALGSELLEDRGQVVRARDLSDDEVALETDTVDLHTGALDEIHNREGFGQLGVCVLNVLHDL